MPSLIFQVLMNICDCFDNFVGLRRSPPKRLRQRGHIFTIPTFR
ncbi:hypothetical protein NSP_10610 [Nodularia spumigena CCY9414]|nr:hypothetical protein NSP_10610 [Nodularia spumigena CCY9414]